MCNQAVCLAAAELERHGISTVALVLLERVARAVRPPRALSLPFRHGYPLGQPDDPELQHRVLEAALALLEDAAAEPPVLARFES